jgi:hypothetical protein
MTDVGLCLDSGSNGMTDVGLCLDSGSNGMTDGVCVWIPDQTE